MNPIGYVLGFLFAMTVNSCCIFECMDNFTVQLRWAYYWSNGTVFPVPINKFSNICNQIFNQILQ